jgi:hypothetical protein
MGIIDQNFFIPFSGWTPRLSWRYGHGNASDSIRPWRRKRQAMLCTLHTESKRSVVIRCRTLSQNTCYLALFPHVSHKSLDIVIHKFISCFPCPCSHLSSTGPILNSNLFPLALDPLYSLFSLQQLSVLEKDLPEDWKLAIAIKIESNLMAKVLHFWI